MNMGIDSPLKENDEKETKTIYAVNKLICENLLYAYNNSFDIPYTIFLYMCTIFLWNYCEFYKFSIKKSQCYFIWK